MPKNSRKLCKLNGKTPRFSLPFVHNTHTPQRGGAPIAYVFFKNNYITNNFYEDVVSAPLNCRLSARYCNLMPTFSLIDDEILRKTAQSQFLHM